jgi:hypothetical protein
MNRTIERVLDTAEAHIGVYESPAGSNNISFNTHYYGREVSGSAYPWCVAFLWDVFRLAGCSPLFFGGEKTASSTALMNYAKRNGIFRADGFRRGDIALFTWSNNPEVAEHAGLIAEVGPNAVRTVEGNTSLTNDTHGGEVMARVRKNDAIIGVCRPAYPEDDEGYGQFCAHMALYMRLAGTGGAHSAWADDAVKNLVAQGVFNGDGAGNYGWSLPITREAAAQIVYNALNAR